MKKTHVCFLFLAVIGVMDLAEFRSCSSQRPSTLSSDELASIRVGVQYCTGGDVIASKTVCKKFKSTCARSVDYQEVTTGGSFTIPGSGGIKVNLPGTFTVAKFVKGCKSGAIEAPDCTGAEKEYADPDFPNNTGTFLGAKSTKCTEARGYEVCVTEFANQATIWAWVPQIQPNGSIKFVKKNIFTFDNPVPFPIGCQLAGLEPRTEWCFEDGARTAKYTKECVGGVVQDR